MTVFSVLMLVLILAITGAAVDIMRHEAERARLQGVLDHAVIAATDLDQKQQPEAVVADYLTRQGLGDVVHTVSVERGLNHRSVDVQARQAMDTVFMRIMGYDRLAIPARAAAEERIANVEISMVLDISGSMRFDQRMDRLKPAAQQFIAKVLDDGNTGTTTLSVVPFAGHVNPGDTLFDYFRGVRLKRNQNNGWGNGDQDAPGNSLCNNNAENADEGATDPSCTDGTAVAEQGFFTARTAPISDIVVYFDLDGDDLFDRAHKIDRFPADAPLDADDFFRGMVAFLFAQDPALTHPDQFLGISVRSGRDKPQYHQVKADTNGPFSDLGPTKHNGKLPGLVFAYGAIDHAAWSGAYVDPVGEPAAVNVNMPSSCVEIASAEFATTAMPTGQDFVPHFHFWPTERASMDWGWCPEEDTAIQYYSSDRDALSAFIGNLRMHDGTGLHIGMKYGLALLDPDNRDAVSHLIAHGHVAQRFEGRPIDWHDPTTNKYIVVMTDGQTTDQYRPVDPSLPINGEVELQTQGSATYVTQSRQADNVADLHRQCALARQNGVVVFAIAFETDAAAADDMRTCASSPSHFFHVQGDEIYEAFNVVARQINNLRLTR